jgi:hypothetical protein
MKKVLIALLLGSLLLFVQAYAVSAGTYVLTDTVRIGCAGGLHADPAGGAAYNFGSTMKWRMSADCSGSADNVRIYFKAPNPWSKTVPQTFNAAPGDSVTSPATSVEGGFEYTITKFLLGAPGDSIKASMASGPGIPSLSTWGVLILVLALIAVSIALLRKRIRVGA